MRIYRFEHNREACKTEFYSSEGKSLTGHGTFTSCASSDFRDRPRFGFNGNAPAMLMEHERCAVTAQQFRSWESPAFTARKVRDWDLVAYDVQDNKVGTDWREDRGQIVFNPEYATYVGTVTVAQVRQAAKDAVKAEINAYREAALASWEN
jgi:hypothetical protein